MRSHGHHEGTPSLVAASQDVRTMPADKPALSATVLLRWKARSPVTEPGFGLDMARSIPLRPSRNLPVITG